jgi:hypothetical protein
MAWAQRVFEWKGFVTFPFASGNSLGRRLASTYFFTCCKYSFIFCFSQSFINCSQFSSSSPTETRESKSQRAHK